MTFHVYYVDKGSLSQFPYAELDTDAQHGFGPEVTSISRMQKGTYRFSVRHYAGVGNISTSTAEVNVVIPDTGIYRFTPPEGQPSGTAIWRVFDIVVDSNGRLTLNTINDYKEGDDTANVLFPP